MFIHTNQHLMTSFFYKKVPIFCRISDESALIRNFLRNRRVRAKPIGRVRINFNPYDNIIKKSGLKSFNIQVGFWKHDHVLGGQDEDKYNKQCWINPWGKPWGLTNDGMVMKHGLCCAVDTWKF